MKDKFYEMNVRSENALEIFKNFVFELGVTCIEEKESSFIITDEENLEIVKFALEEYKKSLENLLNLNIDLSVEIFQKDNKNWIEEYKKGVKAVKVGSFFIHPSWQEPKKNFINIIIDPALAFGSGHHESTNMCLNLISKYGAEGKTALDVGCGSGILSIALQKLGCLVDACDTDEQAVEATKNNALKNCVVLNNIWIGSANKCCKQYDIVTVNIIADIILMLKNELKLVVKNGGILILSGILDKYLDRIKDGFKDFKLLNIERRNEWVSLVFKKI